MDGEGDYFIARPQNGNLKELLCFLLFSAFADKFIHAKTRTSQRKNETRFFMKLSILVMRFLDSISLPLARLGFLVEFTLNFIAQNGGLSGIVCRFIRGEQIVIPKKGTENFISVIGHLDPRLELMTPTGADLLDDLNRFGIGNKKFADFCMLASKLAYENESIIRETVAHRWKMEFLEFFNCWNMYLEDESTQAFMFCDSPKDAKLVVVAMRGTEPFDAKDWKTDVDITWAELEDMGKVHVGFMEAMGVADRRRTSTSILAKPPESENLLQKPLAYYVIRKRLTEVLEQNKDAQFIVTGHSLGGALAVLFPALLLFHNETQLLQKLLAVYTFGQPRVGDEKLADFVNKHLNQPTSRYLRMVYCNDAVPRLPFDDKLFFFKHSGVCLYYNSFYCEKTLPEEPNRNFSALYFIPNRLNALWELIYSLLRKFSRDDEFSEGWFALLFRVMGLALPGISAHSPVNYVNAIRLGPVTFPTKSIVGQVRKPSLIHRNF